MSLVIIMSISCVLASITLAIFSAFLFILLQSGGRGVKAMFDRFTGGGENQNIAEAQTAKQEHQRPSIKSSDALRQRAKSTDFNPAAHGATASDFAAQSAPQMPSFTRKDPLRPSQSIQQPGQVGPARPALSTSRPFQPNHPMRSTPPAIQPPHPGTPSGFPAQQAPAPGQAPQSGLSSYRPPLRGQAGSSLGAETGGLRRRRDSRRNDDHDMIYDDGEGGMLGDLGGMIDLNL